jgi:hypothetical protein
MTLENRLKRLEQRLGPRPAPSPNAITLSLVFTTAELELLEERQLALERRDTSEDTPEMRDLDRRFRMVLEFGRTGKPDLEEFLEMVRRQAVNVSESRASE